MYVYSSLSDSELARALNQGMVGILPTDTVYGIVCAAKNESAVVRLYQAKHREHKPGTIIAASVAQLVDLGIDAKALEKVAAWWPSPLSVVVPSGDELYYLHQGLESLAVRIPAPQELRDLLKQTGPLLTSSANQPGEPPATNLTEAKAYFADSVDFYVDGGQTEQSTPSTLIRLDPHNRIEILRQGAVVLPSQGAKP